jgi:hypothetical protein
MALNVRMKAQSRGGCSNRRLTTSAGGALSCPGYVGGIVS